MPKPSLNLQDSFLNQVRKESNEVKIQLLGGHDLTGFVKGFDNFTVVLNVRGQNHLIYKHAISQIITRRRTNRPATSTNAPVKEEESLKKAAGFNTLDLSNIKIKE
jgi:host factor-I protein